MFRNLSVSLCLVSLSLLACQLGTAVPPVSAAETPAQVAADQSDFFERHVRPVLVQHCYECHSEAAGEQQGGLLLDRESGWINGGEMGKAVLSGEVDASLLITAVRFDNDDLQMPPDGPLDREIIELLERWIEMGAPGPAEDLSESAFSRLGDQDYLFNEAASHWAFQRVSAVQPPTSQIAGWNQHPIDQFVAAGMTEAGLQPSPTAAATVLVRRLYYAVTGLPPTFSQVQAFTDRYRVDPQRTLRETIDRLIDSPAFGEHIGRMWLDVARYADTDSFYRPDTRTPHYFPFAFTYRDYVVDSFNADKGFDVFIREQLAADLMGYPQDAPEIAALGFLSVAPHGQRTPNEALDDWIDVTTRGLMGLTAACARCHDHKFEPVPTADYYSLRGVFTSIKRINALDEKSQPVVANFHPSPAQIADYEAKRAKIDAEIEAADGMTTGGNNRSVTTRIRETDLAELLTFHPGAPARAMLVRELPKPTPTFVLLRGDDRNRGSEVPRRFLKILDDEQAPFGDDSSGRLQLAEKITSPENPLTARVIVNRVWGMLLGSYLVDTPSDFGLQGSQPTHGELLDWLADDFVRYDWSIKSLIRNIVTSRTFLQASGHRQEAAELDSENRLLWRANRKHLSIEMLRDSMLAVTNQLDRTPRGRAAPLWEGDYTRRRAIYGFVNRFNLDPTLRAFDFPTPMQSQASRDESIVPQQALFILNSDFVVDQSKAITASKAFLSLATDAERTAYLFQQIFQRDPVATEVTRIGKFLDFQQQLKAPKLKQPTKQPPSLVVAPWPLVAQSLMMSNEFQYID